VREDTVAAKDVRGVQDVLMISFTHPFTTVIRRKPTGSGGHSFDYAGTSILGSLTRTLAFYGALTTDLVEMFHLKSRA
jgi:hypothetical protein